MRHLWSHENDCDGFDHADVINQFLMIAANENKFDSLVKKMLLKRWLASSNVAPRSLFNASWYEFLQPYWVSWLS